MEGYLEYKCKKCGNIVFIKCKTANTSNPMYGAKMNVECNCSEGEFGVAEIIGFSKSKEQIKEI